MKRFNYRPSRQFPAIFSSTAAIALAATLTSCHRSPKAEPAPPVRVQVEVIGQGTDAAGDRTYSGTVESAEATTVSFSVPGTILDVYVKVGDKVAKGQTLARVKSESLSNSSNIAQAELEEARDAYNRLKMLHDADALPQVKWVEAQAKLKQAENAAELARRAVGDATLTAPRAGYVAEKLADAGQTVLAAQPVLRIVSLNDLQMAISVPEDEISAFHDGMTARVTLDALNNMEVSGRLGQKAVVADPFTRAYTVKFNIPNPGSRILPGMIGNVKLNASAANTVKGADTFTLPSQAVLLSSDNRQFVWILDKGKTQRRFVTANELAPRGVTVTSGLHAGDSVIVAGMQKVSTGTEAIAIK